MIKNDKQLATVKQELKEFEEALIAIKPSKEGDLRAKMHQNALKATTENLIKKIKEYESLKNGNFNFIPVKDFYDISKALIKARLAKDWTQTDLARKMEIDVQQIQRYEARDYEGASIERIQEVIDALEIDININVIVVPKTPNQAQEKVFQNQALFSFV